jgi:hypothetical protein
METTTSLEMILPGYMQRELDQQRSRMHGIAKLAAQALNEESEIYNYAFFKTVSTIATMDFWDRAYKGEIDNPKMTAWMNQCKKSYLAEMEKIPQETCEKIVRILDEPSLEPISDMGFLDDVVAVFRRRLTG